MTRSTSPPSTGTRWAAGWKWAWPATVVPHDKLLDTAREYAELLLKRAPQSIGLAKKLINNIPNMDQTTAIAVEGLAQSILLKTQDHKEGVTAFREKRRPTFQGK